MAWRPFQNFGLKIASLALGTLLWFTVSGHEIERRLAVSVSYSHVPASLEMTGDQFENVSVYVRGEDEDVTSLTPEKLHVLVDLGDAHPGSNLIPLRTDEVVAPLGIEVLQVDPGTVAVTLEKSGQANVTVRANVEGLPAPGYRVEQISVDPPTVIVEGPESRLRSPVPVVTERVPIDGRTSTVTADVNVGVADASLRLREPRTVRVTVRIGPIPPGQGPGH